MAVSRCKRATAALGLLVCAGLISGCGTVQHIYTVKPKPVVIYPAEAAWGVEIAIQISDAIHLEVVNVSKEPVRMLWDDSAYIDVDGRSHRLRTASGEAVERMPLSVPPGSRVDAVLMPVGDSMSNGNDPLLPGKPKQAPRQVGLLRWFWPFSHEQAGGEAVGKPIAVFLALERNGKRRTLTAAYTITDVHSEHHW